MPAFRFTTRAMHAAALPVLDELRAPIVIRRDPASPEGRLIHVVTEEQLAFLRVRFAAAGIQIEFVSPSPTEVPADGPAAALAAARA